MSPTSWRRLPRPVTFLGRVLGLPISAVSGYWFQESRTIRSGVAALAVGLCATLVAGVVLGSATDQTSEVPGLLALIPAAIGMRGSIFGALAARLSTGILTGQFRRELVRNSFLGHQLEAAAILSVASAVQAGVLAWAVSVAFGAATVEILDLVAISVTGGLLSSLVLFVVVVLLARRANTVGFNMDDVGAPIVTAAGDLVTLPALLAATLVLEIPALARALGAVGALLGIAAIIYGVRRREPTIRRIVLESVVVLTLAVTVDVLAGVILEERSDQQFGRAALLLLLPAFIANCGSLGGMLASRLGSKLHLGAIQSRAVPGKLASLDISLIGLLAAIAFAGVGLAGWAAAAIVPGVDPLPLSATLAVTLLAGLLAFPVLSLTAYAAATTSFRFGLDPDNHGIPVVTATMDLAGVVCLAAAITILGMGAP